MANQTARRYLAAWFPWLSADRWRIAHRSAAAPDAAAASPAAPTAFTLKIKGAMRLAAVDAAAYALGIVPGMTLADARARVPELAAHAHDADADVHWLDRLTDGAARYTPLAMALPPDALVLDITGCAHLLGGEAALAADFAARLARLGMTVRLARAATAEAAHALARYGTAGADEAAAIAALPVAALRLGDAATLALVRAGLKTVGAVAARPMAGLAARFGAEAATAVRRLTGDARSAFDPRRALPPVVVERSFAVPVTHARHALAVLALLAGEAAVLLDARRAGGRRFAAWFFRSDGLVQRIDVETSLPLRDAKTIAKLFDERLASLADPIDPGFGFDLIRLGVPVLAPLAPAQLRLDGGAVADAEIAALIDRLSTRLGRGGVRRFRSRDTHIPEAAQLLLPAVKGPPGDWPPRKGATGPPLRPLHLFDPPQPIAVLAEVPDSPPLRFRWRRAWHEVARAEGPERIAGEWWKQAETEDILAAGLTRDYYRIEDARGRRFWIFRHGLYGTEKRDPGWYLHGLFA